MLDSKALAEATAEIVREHVEKATAPLLRRIDELEKRQPVAGEPGRDGASVTVADVEPMVAALVERAVNALPVPKDGEPGKDGSTVEASEVERMVSATVEKAIAALPVARDGSDGKDGTDGRDGVSVSPDEIQGLVVSAVEKAVAALPAAKDGTDGKDGVAVAGALIDREGALVVTLSNGETKSLGVVVGRDGKDGDPGPAGRDALQVKDIDLRLGDDSRTLILSLDDGDVAYTAEIGVPTMIYRGVFKDGECYEKGDTVTWAGSLWHCNAETKDKPGEGSDQWTLAVKKGRDAKPASLN